MEHTDIIKRLFAIAEPKGYATDAVETAKRVCGGFPLVLERFYLELGSSDELQHLQDQLILPGKYPALLEYDYLVFFNENQGVCQAGISKNDLQQENPPIYVGYDNAGWIKTADTLTDFLTAMYGYQASICLEYVPKEFFWVTDEEIKQIEQSFSKRPETLQNWLNFKIDLYEKDADGRIALMGMGGAVQLNYAANNQQGFDELQAVLGNVGEAI